MILTSNRGFAEWGDIFGNQVVATALLDRLRHPDRGIELPHARARRSPPRKHPRQHHRQLIAAKAQGSASGKTTDPSQTWLTSDRLPVASLGNFMRPQSGKLRCPLTALGQHEEFAVLRQ